MEKEKKSNILLWRCHAFNDLNKDECIQNKCGRFEDILVSEMKKTEVVLAYYAIIRTCQNNAARHSSGRKEEKQIHEEKGRQHSRMDGPITRRHH